MTLVAGVDSSTQSCKVVIRDVATGAVVVSGRAAHPDGTEVHPDAWWVALLAAVADAGGLASVSAIAVAGQQHGMVVLDADGRVIRPALLWNDTRSAAAADALIAEFGAAELARRTGSVPVASFTATKLRWLRDAEPENAARVAAVALPHDWLTWRLRGYGPADESPLGPDARRAHHRPLRRERHVVLVAGIRRVRPRAAHRRPRARRRPAAGARPGRGRRHDGRAAGHPGRHPGRRGRRRQRRAPPSASARTPATSSCRSARAAPCSRSPTRRPPTRPARSPASPTQPAPTCRSSPRSTRPASSTRPPHCSASITTNSAAWPSPPSPVPADSCCSRTSRASAPRTSPTRPRPCSA